MLKIKGIAEPSQDEQVIVEQYVYVDFGYQRPPLYWATSGASQLVEIGLEASTGKIVSLNLLLVREVIGWESALPKLTSWDIPQWQGLPTCNLTLWESEETYVREAVPILLRIGSQEIAIEFADRNRTASCIT